MQTTIQRENLNVFTTGDYDPLYKYNIFSKVHNDFIFEKPLPPSNISVKFEVLKKDELELRFYQTKSLANAVDPSKLQSSLRLLASEVPARAATTDFAYGDPFEVLATVAVATDALQKYCYNCAQGYECNGRINDTHACIINEGYPHPITFDPFSSIFLYLDAYGMAGRVDINVIDPATGKAHIVSLLDDDSVEFCSAFPRAAYETHSDGSFYDHYVAWTTALKLAEVPCTGRRGQLSATVGAPGLLDLFPSRSARQKRRRRHAGYTAARLSWRRNIAAVQAVAGGSPRRRDATAELENPLGLRIVEVGVDSGLDEDCREGQRCNRDQLTMVSWDNSGDPKALFRYMGAVYLAVDVPTSGAVMANELRYSIDGSVPACDVASDGGDPWPTAPQGDVWLGAARRCVLRATAVAGEENPVAQVQVARGVRYRAHARVVVYAESVNGKDDGRTEGWRDADEPNVESMADCSTLLQVWQCPTSTAAGGGAVKNVSQVNLTRVLETWRKASLTGNPRDGDDFVGSLQAGPSVHLLLPTTRLLTGDELATLRQRLCESMWGATSAAAGDWCFWRLWAEQLDGAAGELWEDLDYGMGMWTEAAPGDLGAAATNHIRVTALMQSNLEASRARERATRTAADSNFRAIFALAAPRRVATGGELGAEAHPFVAHVRAPRPAVRRGLFSFWGCSSHYECEEGMFCSRNSLNTWATFFTFYIGDGPGCDYCATCFDGEVSVDGACPLDRCGPRSGSFPKCWSADVLLENFSCPDRHQLNLNNIPGNDVGVVAAPDDAVNSLRARFLTPFNRLVGALVVRQSRLRTGPTVGNASTTTNTTRRKGSSGAKGGSSGTSYSSTGGAGSGNVCSLRNDSIARYSARADPSRGLVCLSDEQDTSFYGTDPVFAAVSGLYDGRLDPFDYYNESEFQNLDTATPYGFFPHRYDTQTGSDKVPELLVPEDADNFLLFIDERATSVQARRLLTYLDDGQFLDAQTNQVQVEMNTLNIRLHSFTKIVFTFVWQPGGKIEWDYKMFTVPVYAYEDFNSMIRRGLEGICIGFLALNILSELYDIYDAIRKFTIMAYLMSASNLLDWAHFILMATGWYFWFLQVSKTDKFVMEDHYFILRSPGIQTRARFFLTDSAEERRFLRFCHDVDELGRNFSFYGNIAGVCLMLFVLRLLKALDFQPRMSLVTRTISTAFSDLAHFFALFSIIFVGYLIAGNIMFGHQNEAFSTIAKAAQFLVILLLSFDPTQFYVQLDHASPSSEMFAIYLWTWIFLAFFVLLNILLAILIDGYAEVKKNASMACGIHEELAMVIWHELRRLAYKLRQLFGDTRPDIFISDDQLAEELKAYLKHSPMTLSRAAADYTSIVLGNIFQVSLRKGVSLDILRLRALITQLPVIHHRFPGVIAASSLHAPAIAAEGSAADYLSPAPNATMDCDSAQRKPSVSMFASSSAQRVTPPLKPEPVFHVAYLDEALMDLMTRYGRLGQGDSGNTNLASDKFALGSEVALGMEASLRVECARGVPRMDLGRGADLFCAAFVDGGEPAAAVANGTSTWASSLLRLNRGLFQTETRRGLSEADWVWDEEFLWNLPLPPLSAASAATLSEIKGGGSGGGENGVGDGDGDSCIGGNSVGDSNGGNGVGDGFIGGRHDASIDAEDVGGDIVWVNRNEKRRIIIMVYDRDQFSSDDVVGCCVIPLARLQLDGQLDGWEPVVRPPPQVRGGGGERWLRWLLGGDDSLPELRIKASVRVGRPKPAPGAASMAGNS